MPQNNPANELIRARLEGLNERITQACQRSGRAADSVTLIGVSKTKPASDVVAAHQMGLQNFGENYLQEAIIKIEDLTAIRATWHYIGNIQSNKTKDVAKHFDWVHTVDRLKVAQRLSTQCPDGKTIQTLVQVNIDEDPNKGGCLISRVPELVDELMQFPNLEIRGLMTILSKDSDPRASYESVAQLHHEIGASMADAQQRQWNALSMGMTGDMEDAIAAGATHIRIGTALFGERA